jgi:hypothetical protein
VGIVDGLNRLRACKRVKLKPRYQTLGPKEDVVAFIVSANLQRRNLSKDQQAMMRAIAYSELGKGGRGNKLSKIRDGLPEAAKTARNRLSKARIVLREARDLADLVAAGTKALDEAYNAVFLTQLESWEAVIKSGLAPLTKGKSPEPIEIATLLGWFERHGGAVLLQLGRAVRGKPGRETDHDRAAATMS